MSFTSLASAWLFLLLIPLVVFYFLKLKRPRLEIPSLVLWRQVLSDQRVNSPFQKFKRNVLLLLQILILTLLVLAAMQPFLSREAARAHRLPILIDVSASMAALDRAGGISRLEEVKKRVRELIDGLLPEQEVCLVAFSKAARRVTPFTNNLRELREALAGLEIEDVPGELEESLRLAQALGRSAPFDKVLLYSDGNFPAQTNFELPFKIDFQKSEPAAANYGIVACNARRTPGGHWQIFVQVASSTNAESTTGTLELKQNGAVIAHENVALTKGGSPRLAFEVTGDQASTIEARLELNGFDALSSDNTAWLTLPSTRPLAVFVPERLASYRHALAAIERLIIFPQANQPAPPVYDLVIADREEDLALPARIRCTVGLIPQDLQKLITNENRNSRAIDWRRDSPVLQHVALDDVVFMDQPTRVAETQDEAFAQLGYEALAQGERGPLILERRSGDTVNVHLLFHTDRSTLPFRVGFPIFVSNLVQMALAQAGLAEANAASTGVLPAINVAPERSFRIEGPAGFRRTEHSDARGQLSGIPAPRVGEYVISGDGADAVRIGASLLSAPETSLAAVDQILFNDQLIVTAAATTTKGDRSLWWALAFLGFVAVLVEWWWFHRRSPLTL